MIAVIDYGMGNIGSIIKAFSFIGQKVFIVNDPDLLNKYDKIVLPGVGAFAKAMENLSSKGMADAVTEQIKKGKTFLGICLGYQLLFETSEEEFSEDKHLVTGMGLLNGNVKKFREDISLKIPQIGWNSIKTNENMRILKDFDEKYFYFVHSYYASIQNSSEQDYALTQYGITFPSAVEKDNILACQFHPEKSGDEGINLLRKWVEQ